MVSELSFGCGFRFKFLVVFVLFSEFAVSDVSCMEFSKRSLSDECDLNRLQQCMSLLQTINNDHNLAFACTEKELFNMCRTMQSGLECVHDFVTRCFDEKRKNYINDLLQGAQEVINLLCTPGEFKTKYLRHAPCMKNISTDPKMCGHHYEMLIESVKPSKDQSSSDSIRRQCCAFHSYLLCVTEEAEEDCGVEAAEFIRDYSLRTAGPLIKNQCKNYISGSLMCSFNSGHRPSGLTIPGLLVVPILHMLHTFKSRLTI